MKQSDKQKFRELIMLLCAIAASVGIFASCKTEIPDPINPFPTTTTTTTTVPPVTGDYPEYVSLPGSTAKWSDLKQEAQITSCTFDGGTLRMTWRYLTPWTGEGDEYCDGTVIFWAKGRAAYLDYKPIGTGYSWPGIGENLRKPRARNGHGDLDWKSGDKIQFGICGWRNAAQRSDLWETTIP